MEMKYSLRIVRLLFACSHLANFTKDIEACGLPGSYQYRVLASRFSSAPIKEGLNGGRGGGGPLVGCRLKFSHFVGGRLKSAIFVGCR